MQIKPYYVIYVLGYRKGYYANYPYPLWYNDILDKYSLLGAGIEPARFDSFDEAYTLATTKLKAIARDTLTENYRPWTWQIVERAADCVICTSKDSPLDILARQAE